MRLELCGPNTHKYYYRTDNGKKVLEYYPDAWSDLPFKSKYCDLVSTYFDLDWTPQSKYQSNLVCKRMNKENGNVFFVCNGHLVRENVEFA
jgi:hypothetical protein